MQRIANPFRSVRLRLAPPVFPFEFKVWAPQKGPSGFVVLPSQGALKAPSVSPLDQGLLRQNHQADHSHANPQGKWIKQLTHQHDGVAVGEERLQQL